MRGDAIQDLLLRHRADQLVHRLAVLVDDHRRDVEHAQLAGVLLILINIHLDDLLHGRVGFLQNGQDVLAALRGLVGDAAVDQGAGFVGGDLARDVDVGAGDYGLGLGWGMLVVGLRGELGCGVRVRCEGRWNGRVGFCSPRLGLLEGQFGHGGVYVRAASSRAGQWMRSQL